MPSNRTIPRTCLNCQTTFYMPAKELKRTPGVWCSRACRSAWGARPEQVTRRFWTHVDQTSTPDGCWLWTASVNTAGYGQFSPGHRPYILAHRNAYIIAHGSIPDDTQVNHHCDVKRCVRPSHLYAGTHIENMRDSSDRGRAPGGERNARAKLSEATIEEIRRRYAAGDVTQRSLAELYGVTRSNISCIVLRKSWT